MNAKINEYGCLKINVQDFNLSVKFRKLAVYFYTRGIYNNLYPLKFLLISDDF